MPYSHVPSPTMAIDSSLSAEGIEAQIVRFDIPQPTDTRHAVSEGMQGYLMRGYQPGGVLRL